MTNFRTYYKIALLAGSVMVSSGSVLAQTASPEQPADAGPGDEIVVTAQKRSESIQKVPVAISAIGAEGLRQAGATELNVLMKVTPALHIDSAYGEAQPRFNLRGIGNTEFSPSATPAVGVYVDEVYLNNTLGQGFQLFDIDRVEILRGPQGTLWGKNTTAGVVHAIGKRPTQNLEGYARAEIGNYGRRIFEGAVSGALIDDVLAARASFQSNSYDGYYYNRRIGESAGGASSYNIRLQLLWTPTPDFDLLVKYARGHTEQDVVYSHAAMYANGTDNRGYVQPADPFVIDSESVPRGKIETNNITATARYRFGDGYEITNIAAYVDTNSSSFQDDDAAPYTYIKSVIRGKPRQFSNEFRITSPADKDLSWIIGTYYLHEKLDASVNAFIPGYGLSIIPSFSQTTRSLAAFVNATYKITDQLSVSGGARVTNEKKKTHVMGNYYDCPATEWYNVNSCSLLLSYIDLHKELNNTAVTWDANIKYDFGDSMVYARVARGFRAGGFQNIPLSPSEFAEQRPETLTAYEAGFKSSLLDRRLRVNATVFHYDYKDLQVAQLIGTSNILANTTAKVDGVELEVLARPVQGWIIGGDAAFINPRYGSFPNAVANLDVTGLTDLSGRILAKAAKRTAHLFTSYELPLGGEKSITFRTDWNYSSRVNLREEFANLDSFVFSDPLVSREALRDAIIQNAYWLGDASVSFALNKKFKITGFVRNLTDKHYRTTAFLNKDGALAALMGLSYAPPRTYGASLDFAF